MKEETRKDLIIKCTDNCSAMSIDKWLGEFDNEWFITFYTSYDRQGLWKRIKDSFKLLIGKDILRSELIIDDRSIELITKFIKECQKKEHSTRE